MRLRVVSATKPREQEIPRDDLVGEVLHMRLALGLERVGRLHERDDRAQFGLRRIGAHAPRCCRLPRRCRRTRRRPRCARRPAARRSGSPGLPWRSPARPTPSMQMDMPVRTATKSPGSSSVAATLTSVSPTTFLRLVGHIEQRVDELVFAHGAGVVLEQLAHVEQEHRLPAVSTSRLTNEMPMAEASSTGTVRRGCASS